MSVKIITLITLPEKKGGKLNWTDEYFKKRQRLLSNMALAQPQLRCANFLVFFH